MPSNAGTPLADERARAATELIRVGGAGFLTEHFTDLLTERPAATAFAILVTVLSLPVALRPVRYSGSSD
ncbi:MAG TPA: hypothetical protein VEH31_36960, partial [Streptosporangiaceae bacterium]|nr:hypothetical protein [Streptosporangiaceae bacterium]